MTDRLLEMLKTNANRRGLAMATEARLADALRCTPKELAVAVEGLVARKAIEVLSPLPYLVAKIRTSWAGSGGRDANPSGESAVPYSDSSSLNKNSLSKQISKGNSHRADDRRALLNEILDTLGEENPTLFERLLDHYQPETIRRALDRVRLAKNIQKSRTALFRYLLPRIAKEQVTKR